jgi:hypothetical protein
VDERVLVAVDNNARWCDLVCRSHGIATVFDDGVWAAAQRSPELYPDAVTLRPEVAAEEVLGRVDDGPGCSVKDSFAALDLTPYGFEELFAASWILREPKPARRGGLEWSIVDTPAALGGWGTAAGVDGIVRPELLKDDSVCILAAYSGANVVAGAIANETGEVVGLSNVFGEDAWIGLPAALSGVFPSRTLVGYERGEDLDRALAAGFSEIGPLRVWLRRG